MVGSPTSIGMRKSTLWCALAYLAVAVLAYLPALWNGQFLCDDFILLGAVRKPNRNRRGEAGIVDGVFRRDVALLDKEPFCPQVGKPPKEILVGHVLEGSKSQDER